MNGSPDGSIAVSDDKQPIATFVSYSISMKKANQKHDKTEKNAKKSFFF